MWKWKRQCSYIYFYILSWQKYQADDSDDSVLVEMTLTELPYKPCLVPRATKTCRDIHHERKLERYLRHAERMLVNKDI